MSLTFKFLLILDDDTIVRISKKKYKALTSDEPGGEMPEYANQKVRSVFVFMELANRKRKAIAKYQYGYVHFDKMGFIDKELERQHFNLISDFFGDDIKVKTESTMIDATNLFGKKRFDHITRWEPNEKLKRSIFHTFFPNDFY